MTGQVFTHHAAFVARCSGAALLSYLLAAGMGLPYPVWSSISGIIVSQEKLSETNTATLWRLAGTVMGIAIAVTIGTLLHALGASVAVQMTCAVALCATIVRRWPELRVAMWTAPIVFLSHAPEVPLAVAGLWRGAEVLLGGFVGAALHWVTETAMTRIFGQNATPATPLSTQATDHSSLNE